MRPMTTRLGSVLVLGLAAGCNRYDLFRLTGYEQASFSNKADVLFVVDNSPSMAEVSEELAVNYSGFIEDIEATTSTLTYEGLADAVANYVQYVQAPGAYVDYSFS